MPYTPEISNIILAAITEGRSLRSVCEGDEKLPAASTFLLWVSERPDLAEQYARAMQARADYEFESIFDIADDGSNDWMIRTGKDGLESWVENGEAIARSRLRVDARKWALARMNPRKYGDKVALDHTSTDGTMTPAKSITLIPLVSHDASDSDTE